MEVILLTVVSFAGVLNIFYYRNANFFKSNMASLEN